MTKYIIIGLSSVTLALLIALLWYRGEMIDAKAKQKTAEENLATAKEANKTQSKTIEGLERLRKLDGQTIAALNTKVSLLAQKASKDTAARKQLERSNNDVKIYLNTAVPAELRSLLNGTENSQPGAVN